MAYPYKTKRRLGFIWPRDPLPGNPAKRPRGRRWKDILTGKGPDIFFGDIDGPTLRPPRARWSRWTDVHGQPSDQDHLTLPAMPWANRGNQRYDFRTRTYKIPNDWTWSNVEYRDIGDPGWQLATPYRVWDTHGNMYDHHDWTDVFVGGHGNGPW